MNDHIPDPTKMISNTPRMHSALMDVPDAGFANIWKVGCEIERELNEANKTISLQHELMTTAEKRGVDKAKEELNEAKDRIKRLEEAGDAMVNEGWNEPHLAGEWRKAKEAKP